MPSYKSFCWSLGTTSFRTQEFNYKIEKQLELLNQLWSNPRFANQDWTNNELLQEAYYDFLSAQNFLTGDAQRKAKDAREKTSGLVDIGLLDPNRRLSQVGQVLLNIAENRNFEPTNQLQISNDSYIYLKQLSKASNLIETATVRPFIVTIYVLTQLGLLTKEEFTYLLPLITDERKLNQVISGIQQIRNGRLNVDNIIASVIFPMDNYVEARQMLLTRTLTEDLVIEISFNRKSREYGRAYFGLYQAIRNYTLRQTNDNAIALFDAVRSISGKPKLFWQKHLFSTGFNATIQREGMNCVNTTAPILNTLTENDFKNEFFNLLHLFKAKSTLQDYADLNKRYLKITDTIIFEDNEVKLDIMPMCYFRLIANNLLPIMFTQSNQLMIDCDLSNIIPNSTISDNVLFAEISREYRTQIRTATEARQFIGDNRLARFNELINNRFSNDVLIDLLGKFENRNDNEIQKIVTAEANIPTIFEYILGIIWYKISQRNVNVLQAYKLSLDADLLPRSHATGGGGDMYFNFSALAGSYPQHTMLLEVTLNRGTNQRQAEIEPVSRHLGQYKLQNRNRQAYCVFVAPDLNVNLISDFRSWKNRTWYNPANDNDVVEGMQITPIKTNELKAILSRNVNYSSLYRLFANAHNSDTNQPNVWYQESIVNTIAQ